MYEEFYIIYNSNSGWYQLIVRGTHFCISCGPDLNRILEVLKRYVKTYRTKERLYKSLTALEWGCDVHPSTFDFREDYYMKHGNDFKDLVRQVIDLALAEAREEDRNNSPLRKAQKRLLKAGLAGKVSKDSEPQVVRKEVISPITPKVLHKVLVPKPRLLKV